MNKELNNQPKTKSNIEIDATALEALANILQVRTGLKAGIGKGSKGQYIAPCV